MIPPEPEPEPEREPEPEPAAGPAPETAPPARAPEPPARPVRPAAVRPEQPAQPAPVRPAPAAEEEPVVAVRPAEPIARRPVVRPVTADEEPEGPPCPACGTPNLPGRRFCRRCAAPLQTREQPAPLPWWRTVWPFRRRVRSGSGRAFRRTVLALVVVGLLFAGFLLVPAGRYVFEDVRDKLGGTAEISPVRATASAQAPGHPASAAIDGLTNRYWGAPTLDSSLTCVFDKPFRLVGVVVYTGVSTKAEEFRQGARPTKADLIVTTEGGEVRKKAVTLTDKPGKQTVRTGISDVVSVRLVLRAAAGRGEGRPIAVGEVEFFKRT
ncbi:zinc ribbon domain-containing protein [Streptomyces sp. NPDC001890]|uniref:NADase-type glycan-binding domain-containing protein n=1 Tax=Streptomyces sp. NPDC001890 TaxID=3364620 RepID=UPI00368F8954